MVFQHTCSEICGVLRDTAVRLLPDRQSSLQFHFCFPWQGMNWMYPVEFVCFFLPSCSKAIESSHFMMRSHTSDIHTHCWFSDHMCPSPCIFVPLHCLLISGCYWEDRLLYISQRHLHFCEVDMSWQYSHTLQIAGLNRLQTHKVQPGC